MALEAKLFFSYSPQRLTKLSNLAQSAVKDSMHVVRGKPNTFNLRNKIPVLYTSATCSLIV